MHIYPFCFEIRKYFGFGKDEFGLQSTNQTRIEELTSRSGFKIEKEHQQMYQNKTKTETETLPKAQRVQGLSSYHKITVHSSQILNIFQFQNLD